MLFCFPLVCTDTDDTTIARSAAICYNVMAGIPVFPWVCVVQKTPKA